jgi:hypothetical protein
VKTARRVHSPEEIRTGLLAHQLTEEEKPIDGFAFTFGKHPDAAVDFYRETHGGAEATRFYIAQRTYILSA